MQSGGHRSGLLDRGADHVRLPAERDGDARRDRAEGDSMGQGHRAVEADSADLKSGVPHDGSPRKTFTINVSRGNESVSTIFVCAKRNTETPMTITPAQSRAARGLLDWSQTQAGARANLSESTVRDFEKGRRVPSVNNLSALARALEAAGVIFVDENGEGPGVRLRKAAQRGSR